MPNIVFNPIKSNFLLILIPFWTNVTSYNCFICVNLIIDIELFERPFITCDISYSFNSCMNLFLPFKGSFVFCNNRSFMAVRAKQYFKEKLDLNSKIGTCLEIMLLCRLTETYSVLLRRILTPYFQMSILYIKAIYFLNTICPRKLWLEQTQIECIMTAHIGVICE